MLPRSPTAATPLMVSRPLYGLPGHPYYRVLPVLHEPGPFATSWVTSATGIPVEQGERLRVTSLYDGERPHTRVMGIWHLYLAPGRSAPPAAAPLPADVESTLPAEARPRRAPRRDRPADGARRAGRARPIPAAGAAARPANATVHVRGRPLLQRAQPLDRERRPVRWRFAARPSTT